MIVTSAANGRVHTLDDRPAMDVYLERLGAPAGAYTDLDSFVEFALPRPIGVQRRSGVEARNVSTEIDLAGRSIGGGSALDPGGLARGVDGDGGSVPEGGDGAGPEAGGRLGRQP